MLVFTVQGVESYLAEGAPLVPAKIEVRELPPDARHRQESSRPTELRQRPYVLYNVSRKPRTRLSPVYRSYLPLPYHIKALRQQSPSKWVQAHQSPAIPRNKYLPGKEHPTASCPRSGYDRRRHLLDTYRSGARSAFYENLD